MDGDTSQKGKEIKKSEVSGSAAPPLDLVKLRAQQREQSFYRHNQQKDLADELNYQAWLALKEHREHHVRLEQKQACEGGTTDMDAEIRKQVTFDPISRRISLHNLLAQHDRTTKKTLLNDGNGIWRLLPSEGDQQAINSSTSVISATDGLG